MGTYEAVPRWLPESGPPCARSECGGHYDPCGFSEENARFAHTVADGYYLYRTRYYCIGRNAVGKKRIREASIEGDLIMKL